MALFTSIPTGALVSFFKALRWAIVPVVFVGWAAYASYTGTGPLTTALAPATPVIVGGTNYTAGQPYTVFSAGQCANGCELQDISAQGFWINYSGGAATAGTSEFIYAGSTWYPTGGAITTAVSIVPVATGIITGSHN